ncbi:uncharacterized protein LOC126577372 [Anopheles aquasalis]|uniref:uncharacterized protein LOC126577372 n=1 Tax=Anopheles aquasalis TaxID=42839 RepID=UPI00215AC29A|nr:uncharacterized protein LOC126577372 [Anopheles aquasalis]
MSDATSAATAVPSEAVKPMAKVTMSESSTTTTDSSSSSSNTTETMTMEVSSSSSSTATEVVRTIETVETATMTDEVEQQAPPQPQPEQRKESESISTSSSSSSTDAGQEPVEAEEEPDTLSPLMTDNHTFLQHQELMREVPSLISSSSSNSASSGSDREELQGGGSSSSNSSSPQHCHRRHYHHDEADGEEAHDYGIYDDEGDDDDEDDDELDDEDEMFMRDQEEDQDQQQSRNMKHSETKESISSIDSDVSLSYDRQNGSDSTSQLQQQHQVQQQQSEDTANAGSSSDDAAKDSGCEIVAKQTAPSGTGERSAADEEGGHEEELEDGESAEEAAFETPDDEMCEKIVEQVEFYFSNENILKDAFLLKHVRRNKEGFVSLKLVSSFKRVRQLTKDWRVVGYAIKRRSVKIEVNDLGTKIRRLEALPEHDETTPSRTVVATGLPYDKYTVEKVSELFSKCGEISLIRVLRPGGPIPADVRQFINKHPELQQNECALVEFTESASARRAQSMTEFVVLELVAPKKKTGKKAANVTKFVESYKFAAGHDIERSRGGEGFDRFRMRRGSGFYPKPDMMVGGATIYQPPQYHHHHHAQPLMPMMQPNTIMMESNPAAPLQQYMPHSLQPRKYSFGAETFECFQQQQHQQRRASAYSLGSDASRKFSSCSEGYSSCGEMSRRTSACSSAATDSLSRRTSNCSEAPSRRTSNCSDICTCNARRISQCSSDLIFRRMSQCSNDPTRKYSVGSNYDRKYANSPELLQQQQQQQQQQQGHLLQRRISMDSNGTGFDRKYSTGSITGYHTDSPNISPRKYSSGFDPLRKLSSGSDQYYNGRRISTDSGYDRRISVGSECGSAPRSRAGSILCSQHGTATVPGTGETVVRTPIGPDGSKGFGTRTRRVGVVLPA